MAEDGIEIMADIPQKQEEPNVQLLSEKARMDYLRLKIGLIIGCKLQDDVDVEMVKEFLNGDDHAEELKKVEEAIEESRKLSEHHTLSDFVKRDVSHIQMTKGTVYAVGPETTPEMNEVERIFRMRDQ